MGTRISLGRGRWDAGDGSIFSVADGKRLAAMPQKVTHYDGLRAAKIERAALSSPQLAGMRLLPKFTPGRAMLWGTILAVWGTAGIVSASARSLDIQAWSDAPGALRALLAPVGAALESRLAPLRGSMALEAANYREGATQSEMVTRLRTMYAPQQRS
jgi:hypothetical protein